MARAAVAAPSPDEWKLQTLNTMVRSDREVLAALAQAQRDINRTLRALDGKTTISAQVRRAQLTLAKRNIQAKMSTLWTQVGDITKARRLDAANRIINVQQQLDTFMLTRAGLADGADIAANFADSMRATAESGLDRMAARLNGDSYVPLSDRVYNSSTRINSQLDRLVNSALAQALSAKEFATLLSPFINPNTPGGLRYASMRLARTEINNSAHAMAIATVQDHPWVESMRWHLSGSHPHSDICDQYAKGGPKNDGLYPKASVPAKPHPQCFCYVTPEVPDEEDFTDALLAGHYDQFLERYRSTETRVIGAASQPTPLKVVEAAKPKLLKTVEPELRVAGARVVQQPVVSNVFTEERARKISKFDFKGDKGDRIVRELMRQSEFAPTSANRLLGVRDLSAEIAEKSGYPDALALYDPSTRAIYLPEAAFGEQADAAQVQEVAKNWSSKTDHQHAAESNLAHEFGHHIEDMMERHPEERQALWDTVSDAFGVDKPAALDTEALNAWVRKNKSKIVDNVSKYGASNQHELLAEIWHEFSSASVPRDVAQRIGEEMRRIAEL